MPQLASLARPGTRRQPTAVIATQTTDPDLDVRSVVGRSKEAVQPVISRPSPTDEVSRWEDDGGAVLPPAELAA